MKEPQVPRFSSLDEVLDLGILATKYQVRALQHDVSDLLRPSCTPWWRRDEKDRGKARPDEGRKLYQRSHLQRLSHVRNAQ
jgi:hypothetical protein